MDEEVSTPASIKERHHEAFPSSMTTIAAGLILAVIGSIIGSNWEKGTTINYVGFGMLLTGMAIFVVGLFGTVATAVKTHLDQKEKLTGIQICKPRILFGSIWSMGAGIALVIVGSILGSSFEKESMMNYSGFGLQLAGIAVFVLGTFETVRISANIYVNNQQANNMLGVEANIDLLKRVRSFWHNVVTTRTLYCIGGIMTAMSLLFFSLWQLDLIVSGPVWWSEGGVGWSHPRGAYADDYFQSFVWKTTVGQAYDTLFLLIFISFIVLFVSVFFWPRKRGR
jgi:hypothetical protein